jgi:hypothetical protein
MASNRPFVVQRIATGKYYCRGVNSTNLQKAWVMRIGRGGWNRKFWRILDVTLTIKLVKK